MNSTNPPLPSWFDVGYPCFLKKGSIPIIIRETRGRSRRLVEFLDEESGEPKGIHQEVTSQQLRNPRKQIAIKPWDKQTLPQNQALVLRTCERNKMKTTGARHKWDWTKAMISLRHLWWNRMRNGHKQLEALAVPTLSERLQEKTNPKSSSSSIRSPVCVTCSELRRQRLVIEFFRWSQWYFIPCCRRQVWATEQWFFFRVFLRSKRLWCTRCQFSYSRRRGRRSGNGRRYSILFERW